MYEKLLKLKKHADSMTSGMTDRLNSALDKAAAGRTDFLVININDLKAFADPDFVEYEESIERVEIEDE